jgi:predicted MFS family arabinose efflux permease
VTAARGAREGSHSAGREIEIIALLGSSVLLFTTNIGMVGPLLLELVDEFEVSLAQAGVLAGAMSLPWAIGAPLTGPLSDRFGRRLTLSLSLGAMGIATCLAPLTWSFWTLFAVRLLAGMFASPGASSMMAAVSDNIPASRRATALGWVNAGFGFAAFAGIPIMGAIGGAFGWRWSFLTIGLLTILLAVIIGLRLPPSAEQPSHERGMLLAYRQVLKSPTLPLILGSNLMERCVFGAVSVYLAAFIMQSYSIGLIEFAPLLGLTSLGTIVGNILGGQLADRAPRPRIFGLTQLASGTCALGFFLLTPSLATSILLAMAFGLATSASRPAMIAMATLISSEHRGTALGFFSLTNQGGWVIGPMAGGLALAVGGYGAIGLLCALLAAAGALLMLPLGRLVAASHTVRQHRPAEPHDRP